MQLAQRAFDIGNAYAWAGRNKKLALLYPRGLEQYNKSGERFSGVEPRRLFRTCQTARGQPQDSRAPRGCTLLLLVVLPNPLGLLSSFTFSFFFLPPLP